MHAIRRRINHQLKDIAIINTHNPHLTALSSSPFDQAQDIPIEHTRDTPSLFNPSPSTPSYPQRPFTIVSQSMTTVPWYQRLSRRTVDGGGGARGAGTGPGSEAEEGPTLETAHLLKKV